MWFKVSDTWANHDKVFDAGVEGRNLWVVAGAMLSARNAEGLIEARPLREYLFRAEVGQDAVDRLVEVGLWHDHRTVRRCEPCKTIVGKLPVGKLTAGAYYMHGYLDANFTKDAALIPEERWKHNRGKDLSRDYELRRRIVDRDGHQCRYCLCRVDFKNRTGPTGGTYDHVDPDGENTFENVVVACRRCNGIKKDHTPDEVGFTLHPPPDHGLARASEGLAPPSPGQAEAEPEPATAKPRGRATRETGRAGPGTSPGQAPARSNGSAKSGGRR